MTKRTRRWRSWAEHGTRWGLTLLFVALVGVMAASGWWRLAWMRRVGGAGSATQALTIVDIRCGSVERLSVPAPPRTPGQTQTQRLYIDDYSRGALPIPGHASTAVGLNRLPFNLWRIREFPFGWSIALTYPIAAVALPAAFLWYRRLRRRRRRGACAECGYDLAGLAAVEERIVCPECGAANGVKRGGGRATMLKARTP